MGPLRQGDGSTCEDAESLGVDELLDAGGASARACIAPAPAHRGRTVPLLATVVLGIWCVLAGLGPWKRASPEREAQPRLLQSEDLLSTIVEHSLRFHDDFGGEPLHASELPSREELLAEARKHVHETVRRVAGRSPEAGRLLQDLRLTTEQWSQSKQVLKALHDRRVLEMGQYVQRVVAESETPEEATRRVAEREGELRQLRTELIPAALQGVAETSEGQNHWGFSMQGGVQASGPIGGWQASLTVGGAATARRLMRKAQLLYMIIASAVVLVFGIVSTVMTVTMGPAAALVFFLVTAAMDVSLCGTSLGLHHLPGFPSINTWVPCMALTTFTGLETIWTFNKGGSTLAPPQAPSPAPPPAPSPAPSPAVA